MVEEDQRPLTDGVLRRFRQGELIVSAQSPAEYVYLVRSGQVRVFVLRETGHETTTAVLGPGQLLGLAPMLGYSTYHAFAEALTPVEVWALQADRLLEHLAQDPALFAHVLDALGRRLALGLALLRDVALLPVAERIPHALAWLEVCCGSERPQLTYEKLAGLIGTRPETVSRVRARSRAAGA